MRILFLLSAAVLSSASAQADPVRDALSEVAKCADIAAAGDRLQCFDAAAVTAKAAVSTAPPAPAAASGATQDDGGILGWFGFSTPSSNKPEDFGKPPPPPAPGELTGISAGVIEWAKNPLGKALFVLDNGQVWKQIDSDPAEVLKPSGDDPMKVTIEKAMLGSYSLRIVGRKGIIKVRRVK